MNTISIFPTSGLHRELYYPTPEWNNCSEQVEHNPSFIDANSLFWDEVLSKSMISKVVSMAVQRFTTPETIPIPFRAIISDAKTFQARVALSKSMIVDQSLSPQQFFSHLETLNLYCALYAAMLENYNAPFTIQNGWLLPEDSSETIFYDCLSKEKNPYLDFVRKTIIPIVEKAKPKVVFLLGRPNFFSCALARLLKTFDPSVYICATRHSSEYYSLNKIDFLLVRNSYLFQMYDVIILEHFAATEQKIIASIEQGLPVKDIPNLICRTENTIVHTGYGVPSRVEHTANVECRPRGQSSDAGLPPHAIANVHLFPFVKCYWNQCAFCGINKKYHFENPSKCYGAIDQQLAEMKDMLGDVSYVWFIDEAIPPAALQQIAYYFQKELPGNIWQARCRIEKALLEDGLPELLAASGLRELRLGLESGSYAVLKNMNKFDETFSFSLVEEICRKYFECGISIHFPIIVGFPGENDEDRRATYSLLQQLSERYSNVTFNVNVFGLDIGSTVFRRWYDYSIQSISFPCEPRFFLGNLLQWRGLSVGVEDLSLQRDQFMRETLYPWMPTRCFTPPHILYRLSETIRNTLVWKDRAIWPKPSSDKILHGKKRRADMTIFYDEEKGLYFIYSWYSHHYMLGNECLVDLLEAFRIPGVPDCILDKFIRDAPYRYPAEDLNRLTERLINDGYLIDCE